MAWKPTYRQGKICLLCVDETEVDCDTLIVARFRELAEEINALFPTPDSTDIQVIKRVEDKLMSLLGYQTFYWRGPATLNEEQLAISRARWQEMHDLDAELNATLPKE